MFPESEGDWAWTLSQEGSRDVMAPGAMPTWILFLLWHQIYIPLPSELEIPLQEHPCSVWGGCRGSWEDSISGFLDVEQRESDLRPLLVYFGASWKCINGLVTRSANLEEQLIPRAGFFPHLSSCFLCCNLLGRWGGLENRRRSTAKASQAVRVKCEHHSLGLLILGLQASHWAFLDLSYLRYLWKEC